MQHIWIIDDEQAICWALKRALDQAGYRVTTFSNAEDAVKALPQTSQLDAVMIDMRMPGMDGFAATALIKKARPTVPVIMMTAFGDLQSAIQAIEFDIFEYLTKPFDLADGLKAVAKALATKPTAVGSLAPNDPLHQEALLGTSASMQSVYKQIAFAAKSDVSVLILGPSGIGKESVASAIHRNSHRQSSPFLAFSPIAIPPISVAMELLGSSPGAESDSNKTKSRTLYHRSGALELAGNGVLYINEIGDLPLSLQGQVLRVLEHKQYTPLGSSQGKPCDARIMVSSSRSIASLESEGELLSELRHRLGVFVIEVKGLSERREDILPIANAILRSENPHLNFSSESEAWLASRAWLGNVRELRSAIQHATVLTRGNRIEIEDLRKFELSEPTKSLGVSKDLGAEIRRWALSHLDHLEEKGLRVSAAQSDEVIGTMYEDFLAAVEPPLLESMMSAFQSNRAAIAAQLGLHRSTLRQKMRRYKIE